MRIALVGTRGIPARYGGFETFAEQISRRLSERGHSVLVYGRRPFFKGRTIEESVDEPPLSGVITIKAPTIFSKHLETPLAALTSFFDLQRRKIDVVLLCNAANSPFAWITRFKGIPVAINVDGIERERRKWGRAGRLWYRIGERASVTFGAAIIADAKVIADYYHSSFGASATVIPYGADGTLLAPGPTLERFGLQPRKYVLYVSRLEPENNALGVVTAYRNVGGAAPLVIVGDAPYAETYIARVKAASDSRVIFTGYQFGSAYQELQSNCALYVQATEVGGTHPALIEAMARGCAIVANDVPEHREVLGNAGLYYLRNDWAHLAAQIQSLLNDSGTSLALGREAAGRARACYSWEAVTEMYQNLLERLVREAHARR